MVIIPQLSRWRPLGARSQLALCPLPPPLPSAECSQRCPGAPTPCEGDQELAYDPQTLSSNHSFNQFLLVPYAWRPLVCSNHSVDARLPPFQTLQQSQCSQLDLACQHGSLVWRSKKIGTGVIYCDAFLARDARSQVVNGLALKQHQLNGNGALGQNLLEWGCQLSPAVSSLQLCLASWGFQGL